VQRRGRDAYVELLQVMERPRHLILHIRRQLARIAGQFPVVNPGLSFSCAC
jgi:hypothetical protein